MKSSSGTLCHVMQHIVTTALRTPDDVRPKNVCSQLVSSVKLGTGTPGMSDLLLRHVHRALVATGSWEENTNVTRTVRSLRPSRGNCAAAVSAAAASGASSEAAADDESAVDAREELAGAAAAIDPDSAAVRGHSCGHIHLGIAIVP